MNISRQKGRMGGCLARPLRAPCRGTLTAASVPGKWGSVRGAVCRDPRVVPRTTILVRVGCVNARLPRVIQGELHTLTIDSRVLRDNPLGDPWRRELPVYLPPGNSASGLPVILVLAGFSSVGASLLKGTPWEPSLLV